MEFKNVGNSECVLVYLHKIGTLFTSGYMTITLMSFKLKCSIHEHLKATVLLNHYLFLIEVIISDHEEDSLLLINSKARIELLTTENELIKV